MRPRFLVAGWVLAILFLVFGVERHLAVGRLESRVEELVRDSDVLAVGRGLATGQLDELADLRGARLDDAQAKVDELEELVAASDDVPMTVDVAPMAPAPAAEPADAIDYAAFFARGAVTDEMTERLVRTSVQMQYGEFVDALDLDPEAFEEVHGIITGAIRGQFTNGFRAPNDDADTQRLGEEEYEELLREELATVLSREDMAFYDEYQATREERHLRRSYRYNLDFYGGGLSEENRALVIEVLVEESLIAAEAERESAAGGTTPEEGLDPRFDAYDHALERLLPAMEEDQYAMLERFIAQMRNQSDFIRQATEPSNKSEKKTAGA